MSRLYLSLDDAVDKVTTLCDYLEQKCEIRSCKLCRAASYTPDPFYVRTKMGNTVEAVFNFCPVCGRDLRPDTYTVWGDEDD